MAKRHSFEAVCIYRPILHYSIKRKRCAVHCMGWTAESEFMVSFQQPTNQANGQLWNIHMQWGFGNSGGKHRKTEVRYSFASTNIYRSWANHETDSLQYVWCTYGIRCEDFFGLDSISLEKNQLKKTECQHIEKGFLCSWTKAESCVTLGGAYLLHIK